MSTFGLWLGESKDDCGWPPHNLSWLVLSPGQHKQAKLELISSVRNNVSWISNNSGLLVFHESSCLTQRTHQYPPCTVGKALWLCDIVLYLWPYVVLVSLCCTCDILLHLRNYVVLVTLCCTCDNTICDKQWPQTMPSPDESEPRVGTGGSSRELNSQHLGNWPKLMSSLF